MEMHLWICISEVAKEPPLAHRGTHVQFPSLMQTHEMWSEGRGEEGWSQRATRPPNAAAILVTGSKSFQFCEASEQAEGKEEQHFS